MNTSPKVSRRRVPPPAVLFAALGCVGIGAFVGGWAEEQPAFRREGAPARDGTSASSGAVAGIAIDTRNNFLYRSFTNGRVERLPLGQGVTQEGTTADWQIFKSE